MKKNANIKVKKKDYNYHFGIIAMIVKVRLVLKN